ncbi:Canalicular multispecific organic anion transporter 2 [Beauveria bassiana]|uniref:Canalicular multispecific organic anion transporter 2 n=1 Tax=Beauveria bassiana TaxID=176275 RepID=A0A2N6NX92_BEABA|nr:Canalicular multispecific organic anion transporter 2 [Beauveria bassiana]
MERMPQVFLRIWMKTDLDNDWYFAGFAALSIVEILVTCASGSLYLKQVLPRSSAELHWRLLQTVMRSTLSFISHTELLNRFSQDISMITQRMPLALMTTASMFFNVLVDIGIISSGAKYTPPVMVFLLGILYAIQHYYLRTSRQLRYLELETTAPMITHFTETISGISHIRGLGWQRAFNAELALRLNNAQRPFYYLYCVQQWLTLALDFTTFVCAVTLISVATVFPESTSDSAIGLALLNLISFSTAASWFLRSWVALEISLGGLARIKAFCKHTPVEEDPEDAEPVPEDWPASGRIDYERVSANYTGPHGEVWQALDDASFSIDDGQKIGISGRTGGGKTSMLLSLLHMMEYRGKISIDGRDIKTVPRRILRSRITTLTQDGVELKGTIRANAFPYSIAAAAVAPADEDIVAALDRVGLWAHLQRHGGLDADITDARLSHGQRQLLFLARAVLHHQALRTRIVLVDEATSALDPQAEADAQALMAEAFADCTVLTISHRREGLDFVERVLEVDAGQLVELRPENLTETWSGDF